VIRSASHSSFPAAEGEVVDGSPGALETATALCVAQQARAFVEIVSDGMLAWSGPHEHLIDRTAGLERGATERWFDTTLHQHRLVVSGELARRESYALAGYETAKSVALKQVIKVTLPGPVTLARLADDRHYGDLDALVDAFAGILVEEVAALAAAGVRAFQLDEPMLCRHADDVDRVIRSNGKVFDAAGDAEIKVLSTYYGDLAAVAGRWAELPGTHLGLEALESSSNLGYLDHLPDDRGVYLGCFDVRTTDQEDADDVAALLVPYREALEKRDVIVGPNAGLAPLTQDDAFDKLLHARYVVEKLGREWSWA